MISKFKYVRLIFFISAGFWLTVGPAWGAGLKTLPGHVPGATRRLVPLGFLTATNELKLAIGLPLRQTTNLNQFLTSLYDPASPAYRQYLTPEQFTEKFGPTAEDYQKVINFAQTNGLQVKFRHGNRLLLDVTGPVGNIEKSFHVKLRVFHHPTEARDFFAPDTEPTVDGDLPVVDVSGLENFSRPRPKIVKMTAADAAANAVSKAGSGPGSAYLGKDFRAAYVPGTTLTGAGQMVGLLQFDGFYASDIAAYAALAGQTNIPIQTVLLDGYNGTPTTGANSGNGEVSLDIEMAMAMAPGLAKIVVFEGGPNGIANDVLNSMAASNSIKNLSCSWGWSGGPTATTDNIFIQMAAQGQSFFNASGDSDAFTNAQVDNVSQPNSPSSSPYITQVGGTTLTMNGTGASYASETVWNRGGGVGSSGGISSYYSIPAWQTNISISTNHASATKRNIPDVALTGENVYVKYSNGSSGTFGGTSVAAPLWAGFMALVNQQAAAAGQPPVGFINPAIYTIARSGNYAACFHDTTTGNNTWSSSLTNFFATPGYDLCTGLGTPNGMNLVTALATPDALGILPGTGFTAVGPTNGPFNITSQTFFLTNAGASSLNWSAYVPSWLNISPASGTLPGFSGVTVTASINNLVAVSLSAGVYTTNIVFTNTTSGIIQLRQFTLRVGQPMVQNGGFENGDFSGWSLSGNTAFCNVINTGTYVHTGTYGAQFGPSTTAGIMSQSLVTIPGQKYLLNFSLTAPASGTVQNFTANWNTNASVITKVYGVTNSSAFAWTNVSIIVTAADTNTVLQFVYRNDPDYYALDDVSVQPIPVPSFQEAHKAGTNFVFTWSTLASIQYQVQYSTNLAKTNWFILSTNTANDFLLSITNPIGTNAQRFYRIRQLP